MTDELPSPAVSLVLALSRYSLGTIDRAGLEAAFEQEIDWEAFDRFIQAHRLGSLVYDTFSASEKGLFPEATAALLKKVHYSSVVNHLLFSASVEEIFCVFEQKQLRVLLVKGLAVESWLYDKQGVRLSCDIDLFVDREDVEAAVECLTEMGYELTDLSGRLKPGSRLLRQYLRTRKDMALLHGKTGAMVELHWQLVEIHSAFPLSFVQAWQARCEFKIEEQALASLTNAQHAVYLCYHGTKHRWHSLFWLYDIAKLMVRNETDWPVILVQARKLHAEASLGLAVVLASRLLRAPLPEPIRQQSDIIQTGEQLADSIIDQILLPSQGQGVAGDGLTLDGARQRLDWNRRIHPEREHVWSDWSRYLFSPGKKDWESLRLPDFLTPLYRLWRPIRLIFKGTWDFLR